MVSINKKLFTLLVLMILFSFSAMAQDIIILKNGNEIKSIVQEVGSEYVKYKRFENPTGPNRNELIEAIYMIKYANGTTEFFNDVIVLLNGDIIKAIVQDVGTEYVKYKKIDNPTGPTRNEAITKISKINYANGTSAVFNQVQQPTETFTYSDRTTENTIINSVKTTQAKPNITNTAIAQNADGYIMSVEGDKIYLKLNSQNIKASDVVSVMSNSKVIDDPFTGQQIRLEPEVVGQIKVIDVQNTYSIGRVYGDAKYSLEMGMSVRKNAFMPVNDYGEATVIIAPPDINFPQGLNTMVGNPFGGEGGYIGDYVTAVLMEHLQKSNKIKLLDRSILQMQRDEQNMGKSGELDYNTMLQDGKIMGARYIVKITMQKPDVAAVSNNIPTGAMVRTGSGIAGALSPGYNNFNIKTQPLQQAVPENVATERIKIQVNIRVQVVDLQTSEVLFTSSGIGKANGTPQFSFEFLAGGNLGINQGAHFPQSVTGKAIEDAFKDIAPRINKFFNDKIK